MKAFAAGVGIGVGAWLVLSAGPVAWVALAALASAWCLRTRGRKP